MWTAVAEWVAKHSWRELLGAAVLAILILGVVGWDAHERSIGDAHCQARYAKAEEQAKADHDAMQAKLDRESAAHDAAVKKVFNAKPLGITCNLTPAEIKSLQQAER